MFKIFQAVKQSPLNKLKELNLVLVTTGTNTEGMTGLLNKRLFEAVTGIQIDSMVVKIVEKQLPLFPYQY